eukprot:COSAG01_NODE_2602_length_7394_cov_2.281563_3_plen_188_part_00
MRCRQRSRPRSCGLSAATIATSTTLPPPRSRGPSGKARRCLPVCLPVSTRTPCPPPRDDGLPRDLWPRCAPRAQVTIASMLKKNTQYPPGQRPPRCGGSGGCAAAGSPAAAAGSATGGGRAAAADSQSLPAGGGRRAAGRRPRGSQRTASCGGDAAAEVPAGQSRCAWHGQRSTGAGEDHGIDHDKN